MEAAGYREISGEVHVPGALAGETEPLDDLRGKLLRAMNETVSSEEREQWIQEFEAAARRSLEARMRYAFIKTYKPVMDDAPFRSFATMEDYRRWCENELPSWLGYGRAV